MSEKRFLYRNFLEEEVEKRFTEEYDEKWGIYLSDNLTGDWYNINPVDIVDTCNTLWEQVVKLREKNEQLKNYFKKRAECSNFQINKLKEEIAELQEDNVDTIVELSKENEQLKKKYDNLNSALEKTARDMTEKMIYEMEDFDVFQRITDYVEELDE